MAINKINGVDPNYAYGVTARQLRPGEVIGQVVHDAARTESTHNTTPRDFDPGLTAHLERPTATSDYPHPTPEDVSTAPGQRTVQKPKSSMPNYGAQRPTKSYQ